METIYNVLLGWMKPGEGRISSFLSIYEHGNVVEAADKARKSLENGWLLSCKFIWTDSSFGIVLYEVYTQPPTFLYLLFRSLYFGCLMFLFTAKTFCWYLLLDEVCEPFQRHIGHMKWHIFDFLLKEYSNKLCKIFLTAAVASLRVEAVNSLVKDKHTKQVVE